jgi:hypothetical protein
MAVAKVMKKDIEKNMAINKMLKWYNIYIYIKLLIKWSNQNRLYIYSINVKMNLKYNQFL